MGILSVVEFGRAKFGEALPHTPRDLRPKRGACLPLGRGSRKGRGVSKGEGICQFW